MADWLQLHKDKKAERKELNHRRDIDEGLVTSFRYVMQDARLRPIKDIVNVTMNRLKVFRAYVEASLNKADEMVVVESDDEALDTAIIEDVIKASFMSANHRLIKRGEFKLEPYFDQQATMRGEAASLVLFQMQDKKEGRVLDTNITPLDTRFFNYETSEDGLAWHSYETTKTRGMIAAEAWAKDMKPITGKDAQVIDLWAPDEHIVYVNNEKVFGEKNPFGYPPGNVQKVPIGSMLAGEHELQYQCESIFFLVRELINEYNRCVSIMQTHNLKVIKPPMKQKKRDGGEPSDYDDVAAMGANTAMLPDEDIAPIDFGDAKRSMVFALQEINKALDDGTLSRITLGDLPGELSAVALIQIEQGQGQVFMPRLGTRGLLKEQISRMLIQQIIFTGESAIEIGTPGHKKSYKVSDLEGEYDIVFRYANKSPETDFARLSIAERYKNADMLDELTILTDIMKRDDPEGDLMNLQRQRLRRISPNLTMYDGLMALADAVEAGDEGAKDEIDIIEAELGVRLDQMLSGNLIPSEPELKAEMPLLTEGVRSSAQKAADLQRTPIDEGE